jgi:hypothetical protein
MQTTACDQDPRRQRIRQREENTLIRDRVVRARGQEDSQFEDVGWSEPNDFRSPAAVSAAIRARATLLEPVTPILPPPLINVVASYTTGCDMLPAAEISASTNMIPATFAQQIPPDEPSESAPAPILPMPTTACDPDADAKLQGVHDLSSSSSSSSVTVSRGGKARRGDKPHNNISDSDRTDPDADWPYADNKHDCCADCKAPGFWPEHLDKSKPFRSEDGSYVDASGVPHWQKTHLCEGCRNLQQCECSYCWSKRMVQDEPHRNSRISVSLDGKSTVHIAFSPCDFQAQRCAGCRLISPRAPHTPQHRKVCCECHTHYCSLLCLETDFPRHHAERGCSANKGQDVMAYFKEIEIARGERKILEATKACAAAAVLMKEAEQDLAQTTSMFSRESVDDGSRAIPMLPIGALSVMDAKRAADAAADEAALAVRHAKEARKRRKKAVKTAGPLHSAAAHEAMLAVRHAKRKARKRLNKLEVRSCRMCIPRPRMELDTECANSEESEEL